MDLFRKSRQNPFFFSMLLSLVICICIILVRSNGGLEFLELTAYDYYLGFRAEKTPPDDGIVLIGLGEEDIRRYGHWPLTDAELAELLSSVEVQRPAAIGLDIYRDIPVPPGRQKLIDVFSRNSNIVTIKKIGDEKESGIARPYAVTDASPVGSNDLVLDQDGMVRRGILFLDDGHETYSSLSLLLALVYLRDREIAPEPGSPDPQHMKLGKSVFVPLRTDEGGYSNADVRGYQFLMDYRGGPFIKYSFGDVISKRIPEGALSGKIVIIGSTAESLKDYFYTPLSRTGESHKVIYGIEIHGYLVSQILRAALTGDRPVRSVAGAYENVWIIFWGLLGALLGLRMRSFVRFFLLVSSGLTLLLASTWYAFSFGWWIPLVPPALACLISSAAVTAFLAYAEKADRALLMQLFSSHVSKDVAETIWQQREQFMMNGRPRPDKITATVLFTDLKGFTSISEMLDPQAVMDWLNEYMESMAQIIIRNGGVINKYIGDSIMALFGVPVARLTEEEIGKDAINAVTCAVELCSELDRLNSIWEKRGLPVVAMRIGIYTGSLVAGCLGSSQRMEYTVIGDTVNVASRLESYDKDRLLPESGISRILIGESTEKYIGDRFITKKVGEVSLKGKAGKTNLYMVSPEGPKPEIHSS